MKTFKLTLILYLTLIITESVAANRYKSAENRKQICGSNKRNPISNFTDFPFSKGQSGKKTYRRFDQMAYMRNGAPLLTSCLSTS